jgi:predicted ester cyclase
MASQDLGTVVREMISAWNGKDLDRCASYAHQDAKMTIMPFGMTLGFREYIENWARAFPDGKLEIKNVLVQEDKGMCEFTGRGTHTGTLKGPTGDLPATQRRVELPCIECYSFRGGKLAEGRVYFDAFSMFTQLGVGATAQGRGATTMPSGR